MVLLHFCWKLVSYIWNDSKSKAELKVEYGILLNLNLSAFSEDQTYMFTY